MSTAVERVMARSIAEDCGHETPCRTWQGARNQWGYGQVMTGSRTDGSRRLKVVHLVTYEHFFGTVDHGLEVDHLCSNRSCVNPDHLEAVTHGENVRRSYARRRAA